MSVPVRRELIGAVNSDNYKVAMAEMNVSPKVWMDVARYIRWDRAERFCSTGQPERGMLVARIQCFLVDLGVLSDEHFMQDLYLDHQQEYRKLYGCQ